MINLMVAPDATDTEQDESPKGPAHQTHIKAHPEWQQ